MQPRFGTDLCRKRGQNPIPEGKIGYKTNEFPRRLRLNHCGPGHCMITVAKSMRHWARVPAPQQMQDPGRGKSTRHWPILAAAAFWAAFSEHGRVFVPGKSRLKAV